MCRLKSQFKVQFCSILKLKLDRNSLLLITTWKKWSDTCRLIWIDEYLLILFIYFIYFNILWGHYIIQSQRDFFTYMHKMKEQELIIIHLEKHKISSYLSWEKWRFFYLFLLFILFKIFLLVWMHMILINWKSYKNIYSKHVTCNLALYPNYYFFKLRRRQN